jgi:hypothetical protein
MPIYEIYFFGLICHVSPDRNSPMRKSHATIVRAKKHGASIAIDGGVSARLTKHEVSFSANAAYIDISQDSFDHLPHLSPPWIFSGTPDLKSAVKQKKSHTKVLTYINYPDSTSSKTLQIADMYKWKAKYTTANIPLGVDRCLARLLVLSVEQPGPLTVDLGKGPIAINSWALFYNSSRAASVKDFKSYKDITDAGGICDVSEDAVDCTGSVNLYGNYRAAVLAYIKDLADKHIIVDATDLECANSHWP